MARIHRCGFCKKHLPTTGGVKKHIENTRTCYQKWYCLLRSRSTSTSTPNLNRELPIPTLPTFDDSPSMDIDPTDILNRQPHVEEVPDEDALTRLVERYLRAVAEILTKGRTRFERWERDRLGNGRSQWAPFATKADWELALWLATNVGHNQIDEFLKLSVVSIKLARSQNIILYGLRLRPWSLKQPASTDFSNRSTNFQSGSHGFLMILPLLGIFSMRMETHLQNSLIFGDEILLSA